MVSSPDHRTQVNTVAFESNLSSSTRVMAPAAHHDGTLGEVLEIIQELIEQHETRLCLALLQALYCKPLVNAPLEAADCSVKNLLSIFVNEQQKCPNKEALDALAARSASRKQMDPPAPPNQIPDISATSEKVVSWSPNTTVLPVGKASLQGSPSCLSSTVESTPVQVFDLVPGDTADVEVALDTFDAPLPSAVASQSKKTTIDASLHRASLTSSTQSNVQKQKSEWLKVLPRKRTTDEELEENLQYGASTVSLDPKQGALAIPTGWWIIHPNSAGRLKWDLLGVIFIAVEAFLVPLSLGFDVEPAPAWFWTCTGYFMCDLCSQFSTGIYQHGCLVMKQNEIIKAYAKGFFLVDLCATLPWEHMFSGGEDFGKIARIGKLMRLFRLLRLLRLKKLIHRIEDVLPGNAVLFLELLKMLMLFGIMCHWVACVWGFIGLPKNTNHSTADSPPHNWEDCEPGGPCEPGIEGSPWLHRSGLDNFDVSLRYIVSLQFAAGLLLGADWPVTPGFWGERIFICFMMVLSFFMCSLVLSQIVVVVNELSESKKELAFQIRCMKEYMRAKKVPVALQAKVRQYLEYQHHVCNEKQTKNLQFLNSLSQFLRLEVMEGVHGYVVLQNPLFQEMPRPVLQRVCNLCESLLCGHQDAVVHRGQSATSMMFLVKGSWNVLNVSPGHESETLEPPCWIGYTCLFKDMIWPNTCVSIGPSELLRLGKEELLQLLYTFPESMRVFKAYQIRILEGDLISTGVKCGTCGKFGHSSNCCSQKDEGSLSSSFVNRATQAVRRKSNTPKVALMPTRDTKKLVTPASALETNNGNERTNVEDFGGESTDF